MKQTGYAFTCFWLIFFIIIGITEIAIKMMLNNSGEAAIWCIVVILSLRTMLVELK